MPDNMPSPAAMIELVGPLLYEVWQRLRALIEERYDTDRIWSDGGKRWDYEYKYRRGGKTLCCLYARERCVGLMIIFGKDEREKVEAIRNELSAAVCQRYDAATTFHDGKWVMFEPTDATEFDDYLKLLAVKRRPNRKKNPDGGICSAGDNCKTD